MSSNNTDREAPKLCQQFLRW